MNPTSPIHTPANTPNRTIATGAAAVPSRESITEKLAPFCRLLKHHTADQFLNLLAGNRYWEGQLQPFVHGTSAEPSISENYLGMWLLSNRETNAFLACLDMVAEKSLSIKNKNSAETLLEAMHSAQPLVGLDISVPLGIDADGNRDIIEPLAAAFRMNNGLDELHLSFSVDDHHAIAPLLDALRSIKDLCLEACCTAPALHPALLTAFAKLFSENKDIKHFGLNHRFYLNVQPDRKYTAAMNSFLETLTGQRRLTSLDIEGVPQEGQKALGQFLEQSQAIGVLVVSLHGDDFTKPLLDGLMRNRSLEYLDLTVVAIGDGMLPVVDLFAENKCGLAAVKLKTYFARRDRADGCFVSKMLGANATLSFFRWEMTDTQLCDLTLLGPALQANTSLEHLIIDNHYFEDGREKFVVELAVQAQLPDFVRQLSGNRMLTDFDFFPGKKSFAGKRVNDPGMENILDRNRSYRDYACSEAFITGAACGLFQALHLPPELGVLAAPHLQKQRPRLKAGSLAFVNKATYRWAVEKRGQDKARMVEQAPPTGIGKGKSGDRLDVG